MAALADQDGRVVVTQDADIRSSHLLTGSPARLLIVDASSVQGEFQLDPSPRSCSFTAAPDCVEGSALQGRSCPDMVLSS